MSRFTDKRCHSGPSSTRRSIILHITILVAVRSLREIPLRLSIAMLAHWRSACDVVASFRNRGVHRRLQCSAKAVRSPHDSEGSALKSNVEGWDP
ncbi:hypothetical protein P171DRAFT_147303 [Karstenula rhodostoma CBS 690.94]|uniref:Uncharacterized protein n=1 Tax=Karstenula rhodostoma CBS 690.94 TaxID=1392251 RepID=A0A9P4PXS3_9PLEO|nr:hypothetical protein P171DRAFT_147303 [Karstenula rhodostoma CBS 690.94]